MWSLIQHLLVGSLAVWTAAAEISFVVEATRDNGTVDISSELELVKLPPRQRWQHGSRHKSRPPPSKGGKRDVVSFSGNWCGASQHSTPDNQIVNAFSWLTAPDLTLRPGQPIPQYVAAWVGIDGAACKQALLQAGVTTVVNSNGGQSASAWWQWYPESSFTIKGFPVKPGDWVTVNITALTATSGKISLVNANQGVEASITVSNGPKLCRIDAEWLIEDFYDSDMVQVPFAQFADAWFLDAAATTVKGTKIGIDGAAMVQLQNENGTIVCHPEKWDNANFVAISS